MRLPFFLFLCLAVGCTTHKKIVEKPFGYETKWQEGSSESHLVDSGTVEIIFPAGEFGPSSAGLNWAADLDPKDDYTISYDVKFSKGFDFVKGGKLPGLCGGHGKAGEKPKGSDKFSSRIMWRRDGKVVSYVYHLDQKDRYGDDFSWLASNGENVKFVRNQWHAVKIKVHLNSISKSDGFIFGNFDGNQALDKTDLRFRDEDTLKIDHICFNTFFGGNDSSWAPSTEQILWIRNLKVE